jgi:hypothetical protein
MTEKVPEDVAAIEQVMAKAPQGQARGSVEELLRARVPYQDVARHIRGHSRGVATTEQVENGGHAVALLSAASLTNGGYLEVQSIHRIPHARYPTATPVPSRRGTSTNPYKKAREE